MNGQDTGADAGDPSADPLDRPSDRPADPGPADPGSADPGSAEPHAADPGPSPGPGRGAPTSAPGWGPPASDWGPPARDPGPGWGPPGPGPGPGPVSGWGAPEAPYGWGSWQGVPPPGPGPAAAPKPGLIPLRPLDLGEILDGALQAYRRHPRAMVGLPAVVGGVALVLSLLVRLLPEVTRLQSALGSGGRTGSADRFRGAFDDVRAGDVVTTVVLALVLGVVYAVALQAVYACLVRVVADGVLGRRRTVRSAWAAVRGRVARLVGVVLLQGLAGAAVVVVAGGLTVAGIVGAVAGLHGGVRILVVALVGLIGLAVLAVASVFLYTRWVLAPAVLLLDEDFPLPTGVRRPGVAGALGGSWRLVRGSGWRVLGITVVVTLIAQVAAGLVSVPFSAIGVTVSVAASARSGGNLGSSGIAGLGSLVGAALALPFTVAALTLLYLDLRMRRGLDLTAGLDAGPATGGPGSS